MANIIRTGGGSKKPKGNAQPENVLSGKTFTNESGQELTGIMTNRGSYNATLYLNNSINIPEGYHDGTGQITSQRINGTAQENEVMQGKTFYNTSGMERTGIVPNQGAWTKTINPAQSIYIPYGFHNGSGQIHATVRPVQEFLQAFGFINVPSGQWGIMTGNVPYNNINNEGSVIPLCLKVTFSQQGGTPEAWVKYGNTKLLSVMPYLSNWSATLFCGIDLNKQMISVSNISSCNVTVWLERIG